VAAPIQREGILSRRILSPKYVFRDIIPPFYRVASRAVKGSRWRPCSCATARRRKVLSRNYVAVIYVATSFVAKPHFWRHNSPIRGMTLTHRGCAIDVALRVILSRHNSPLRGGWCVAADLRAPPGPALGRAPLRATGAHHGSLSQARGWSVNCQGSLPNIWRRGAPRRGIHLSRLGCLNPQQ
jgi:hypothetical protein